MKTFVSTAVAGLVFAMSMAGAQAANLDTNLIVNGDAESGTTGWTAYAGTPIFGSVDYGPNWVQPYQPGPTDRGAKLFVGDTGNAYAAGFQQVDITALSTLVSAGQAKYQLGGWLGGWANQQDNALLNVSFLDSADQVLGTAQLGPMGPAERGNTSGLFYVETSGWLPSQTTQVQFSLSMERVNGGDNDGYADNLSFKVSAVPEPGSYALMALGLLAVGAVARRRNRA